MMRLPSRHRLLPAAAAAVAVALWSGSEQLVAAHEAGAQKPISGPISGGSGGGAAVEGGGSPLTGEFGRYIDGLLEEWHVPGLAVGVVDGDDTWTEVRRAGGTSHCWDEGSVRFMTRTRICSCEIGVPPSGVRLDRSSLLEPRHVDTKDLPKASPKTKSAIPRN